MLLPRFQRYCTEHNLYQPNNKWLLAVSGGIDSMVLAHLCWSIGLEIGIAHCNFTLRGAESDGDEICVKHWAQERQIPFFTIAFNTKKYAAERGISTQMAARDLRYAWFEEIRKTENYSHIAVAHHADDNAETLLINLSRGTGLKGLRGMQPIVDYIARPLLFATRDEITEYAKNNGIIHREDATNATTDYARNRIRHTIIPELQKINPAATKNILQTAAHLTKTYQVIEHERREVAKKICTLTPSEMFISIEKLKNTPHRDFWLYELLQPYNFSGAVVTEILQALDGQSGKRFQSATHELLKDRTALIVHPLTVKESHFELLIDCGGGEITTPIAIEYKCQKNDEKLILKKERNTAYLDLNKLEFPLTLRLWSDGDTFVPFGMQGMKKLSDFLIDEKMPLHEKSHQYVITSGKNIVWVVGRRIDDRYKITADTEEVFIMKDER